MRFLNVHQTSTPRLRKSNAALVTVNGFGVFFCLPRVSLATSESYFLHNLVGNTTVVIVIVATKLDIANFSPQIAQQNTS